MTTLLMSSVPVCCIQIYLDRSRASQFTVSQATAREAEVRERGKKRIETDGGFRPALATSHRDSLVENIMNPY